METIDPREMIYPNVTVHTASSIDKPAAAALYSCSSCEWMRMLDETKKTVYNVCARESVAPLVQMWSRRRCRRHFLDLLLSHAGNE